MRAYALLRWSVHESNPDPKALDSALKIIHESELMLLAESGLKTFVAGKKGGQTQKRAAEAEYARIRGVFDRLWNEPLRRRDYTGEKTAIVRAVAKEVGCEERKVWRALKKH